MAARSSAMPSPRVRRGENDFAERRRGASPAPSSSRRATCVALGDLQFVMLGQNDLIGDGATDRGDRTSRRRDPSRRVARRSSTKTRARLGPPAQIVAHQLRPGRDLLLADGGVAIARHVDETQPLRARRAAEREEIELLRAPRRVGDARQRLAVRQGVEKRGFADVGAPGEGDLRRPDRRQIARLGAREDEFAGPANSRRPSR